MEASGALRRAGEPQGTGRGHRGLQHRSPLLPARRGRRGREQAAAPASHTPWGGQRGAARRRLRRGPRRRLLIALTAGSVAPPPLARAARRRARAQRPRRARRPRDRRGEGEGAGHCGSRWGGVGTEVSPRRPGKGRHRDGGVERLSQPAGASPRLGAKLWSANVTLLDSAGVSQQHLSTLKKSVSTCDTDKIKNYCFLLTGESNRLKNQNHNRPHGGVKFLRGEFSGSYRFCQKARGERLTLHHISYGLAKQVL
ncbi:uncharacterized protein LOC110406999 [Numida meleagris]|uniref:uncharacterized protein LOC110406999 n=1 Tax=Numida meleagris TaxID=8996 RepID=UPI000B3DBCED|nr:uncharacterized protein LOC110406999 [Numida meleagris]